MKELNESLNKVGKSQSKLKANAEQQEILVKKLSVWMIPYCLALVGMVALFLVAM